MEQDSFIVAGSDYRFCGMPAQAETRILKRFAPLIADALPMVLAPGPQLAIREGIDVPGVVRTVFDGWGRLADADTDMIERACLGALARGAGDDWLTVWPAGEPEPAFADIDGAVMMNLVAVALGRVVKRWVDRGVDSIPGPIRAVMQLH